MIVNFVWILAFKLSAYLVIQLDIFGYGTKAKFPIDDSMMRAIQGTLGVRVAMGCISLATAPILITPPNSGIMPNGQPEFRDTCKRVSCLTLYRLMSHL